MRNIATSTPDKKDKHNSIIIFGGSIQRGVSKVCLRLIFIELNVSLSRNSIRITLIACLTVFKCFFNNAVYLWPTKPPVQSFMRHTYSSLQTSYIICCILWKLQVVNRQSVVCGPCARLLYGFSIIAAVDGLMKKIHCK